MGGFGRRLYRAVYALICVAPAFIWICNMLSNDYIRSVIMLGATAAIAYALTFVPGRVHRKPDPPHAEPIERRAGDPDPDRGLRSDSHEAITVRQGFPLRAIAVMLATVAMFTAVFFMPVSAAQTAGLFERLILSGLAAAALPLTLGTLSSGVEGSGMGIGAGMYAISGIAQYFVVRPELNAVMPALAVIFLAMTAIALNDMSLYKSAAARPGARPPKSVYRRNRLLMLLPCGVVVFIALFDQIRAWAANALRYAVIAFGRVMLWLGSLLSSSDVSGSRPGLDMPAELGGAAAEPSAFWQAMEKAFTVITVVILAVVILLFMRKLARSAMALLKRALARFIQFGHALGEGYHDESESLIDWGETRRAVTERASRQWARLRRREKRWPRMDGRERARYIVRRLYMRSGAGALSALTIREAVPYLPLGAARPGELAAIYERARYTDYEVDADAVDALRRQVGSI